MFVCLIVVILILWHTDTNTQRRYTQHRIIDFFAMKKNQFSALLMKERKKMKSKWMCELTFAGLKERLSRKWMRR